MSQTIFKDSRNFIFQGTVTVSFYPVGLICHLFEKVLRYVMLRWLEVQYTT